MPQTWLESFRMGRFRWAAEFAFRSALRVLIRHLRKGLRVWWWVDRWWPTSGRAFPAPRVASLVLSVSLDNAVGRAIFYGRGRLRYEPTVSRVLLEELRPGDVVLDGGASFGWYTALANDVVGRNGLVFSVEANRARARVLADDLRRAKAIGTPVIGAALGAISERAVLRLPEPDSDEYQRTIGTVGNVKAAGGYDTEVITLDSLALPRLDVLKLDIEGAEFDALLGARETLVRCRPRLLLVEVIEENLRRFGRTVDDLAAFLESLDYSHEQIGGPDEAPMWKCRPRKASESVDAR